MSGVALLRLFGILQAIAILLGMIAAGDWNISHWSEQIRGTVATLPASIMMFLILLYVISQGEED